MKLIYSPASPYVRKVVACAIARDIDRQIERLPTNPHASPPDLLAANPLSKVPCLVTEDGLALFDSPVICEYLDSVGVAAPLFPPTGGARLRALKYQAMADGILDAAVLRRMEAQRPAEDARSAAAARQKDAVARTLAALEVDPPHPSVDIGSISVACALGYLDFRFDHEPWRSNCPRLAAWFAEFATEPCIADTVPREAR